MAMFSELISSSCLFEHSNCVKVLGTGGGGNGRRAVLVSLTVRICQANSLDSKYLVCSVCWIGY